MSEEQHYRLDDGTSVVHTPVTELRAGDEFWDDVVADGKIEVVGTSMFYRLIGEAENRRPYHGDVAWTIEWLDGARDHRQWRPDRMLAVRQAKP